MTKRIYVPVGLPGSGKTSWIKKQRENNPQTPSVVISGDQIRLMLHMGEYCYSRKETKLIIDTMVEMALRFLKTYDVVFLDEYYLGETLFDRAWLESNFDKHTIIGFAPMKRDLGACIHRRCTDTREDDTSRWPKVLLQLAETFEPL